MIRLRLHSDVAMKSRQANNIQNVGHDRDLVCHSDFSVALNIFISLNRLSVTAET